jgi:epsilon-lactone hydrolase
MSTAFGKLQSILWSCQSLHHSGVLGYTLSAILNVSEYFMFWLLILLLAVWAITHFYLKGENLSAYDSPKPVSMSDDSPPSEGLLEAEKMFQDLMQPSMSGGSGNGSGIRLGKGMLTKVRGLMDDWGRDVNFDGEIIPVNTSGVRGEWLVPKGANMNRRMLYIHGGAFIVGSPLSHRAITTYYANMIGGPVLSLDYSLSPESRRQAGIDDCRNAYRWLLGNSPTEPSAAETLFISGDSAGGNLALMLSAWVRDSRLQAPNAVVALSPLTDATLSSPSMRENIPTDKMLGPVLGKLGKTPNWILSWTAWFTARIAPSHPSVSPVMGDLGGLPPTLVQASEVEMLRDDCIRCVNKARASGSPVEIQTWNHVMHVWQMFHANMPEGQHAMLEIEKFLKSHSDIAAQEAAA